MTATKVRLYDPQRAEFAALVAAPRQTAGRAQTNAHDLFVSLGFATYEQLVPEGGTRPVRHCVITEAGRIAFRESVPAKEIAEKINRYLRRFERDPKINAEYTEPGPKRGMTPFFMAGAYASNGKVGVRIIAHQGAELMSREDATAYLSWLDAGNVGTPSAHRRAIAATAAPTQHETSATLAPVGETA